MILLRELNDASPNNLDCSIDQLHHTSYPKLRVEFFYLRGSYTFFRFTL
jgi:hypothetical protein